MSADIPLFLTTPQHTYTHKHTHASFFCFEYAAWSVWREVREKKNFTYELGASGSMGTHLSHCPHELRRVLREVSQSGVWFARYPPPPPWFLNAFASLLLCFLQAWWSSTIMGFSPQTFIIKRNSALSLWEYELRGSMWLSPLLEHGNTIKGQRGKKHIRPSHSALLSGGTFGLCGEVSALYFVDAKH